MTALHNSEYDALFEEIGKRYVPEYDWRWFKAQGYQESLLQPDAVSPVGAMGIMQIMPGTWQEETERLGINASPFDVHANITVGIYYMRRMIDFWHAPRTALERLELAFASYNAGAGNILKAQMLAENAHSWTVISQKLEDVTGRHSKETITYVRRIEGWYRELLNGWRSSYSRPS